MQHDSIFKAIKAAFLMLLAILFISPTAAFASDTSSAVVFVYHRIGQDDFTNSNLSISSFRAHINMLKNEGFNVMSLPDILKALGKKEPLPENTVALTFDGAFAATRDNAIPILIENKTPFTLFFSSSRIDRQAKNYMNWDDLRTLKTYDFVSLGMAPSQYTHAVQEDAKTIKGRINTALTRIEDELDIRPILFSYPFGEYSKQLKDIVKTYKFAAAFGQHSGAMHELSDFYSLPRFSMTESFAGLDRFRLTARSKPLALTDIVPDDHYIGADDPDPTRIGFTIDKDLYPNISDIACFAADLGKLNIIKIDDTRFEMALDGPMPEGRTRINCTLPALLNTPGEDIRWHWHGMMLTKGLAADTF